MSINNPKIRLNDVVNNIVINSINYESSKDGFVLLRYKQRYLIILVLIDNNPI